jgi:hypothetical protein
MVYRDNRALFYSDKLKLNYDRTVSYLYFSQQYLHMVLIKCIHHLQYPIRHNIIVNRQNKNLKIFYQYFSGYDHIIQSAAETLAAFTHPTEISMINNSQVHFPSSNAHQSSTRRSIKNLSGANNSTRMYYCETCRIACGGHATYQAHLNGSKHKKKELVTQTNSVNISSKIGVNILRCELCDITCTSSDAYKAHLDGSKHEKVKI